MGRAGDERKIGRGGELGLGPGWAAKSQVANIPEIVGQASQQAPGGDGDTFGNSHIQGGLWAHRFLGHPGVTRTSLAEAFLPPNLKLEDTL